MTKHYPMTDEQKKINMNKAVSKYKERIKEDEIICEACCIPVKKLSLSQHNRGKKHIEKSKNVSKDIEDVISKALDKIKTGVNIKETVRELFYYIKNDYFDEDENEILDETEQYKETDAKTDEEKQFCGQMYNHMVMDIDEMIEDVSDVNLYESIESQRDKVDATKPDAKQKLLNIWRRIKSPEKPKEVKTIEEPKVVKKVEIKEVTLDEPFPPYSRFIKASNTAKIKCLENIAYNYQEIFEESNDLNIVIDTIESENVDDYDEVYKRITILKSDYDDNMALNGEEEEEDF
jgi:hypothetical protein